MNELSIQLQFINETQAGAWQLPWKATTKCTKIKKLMSKIKMVHWHWYNMSTSWSNSNVYISLNTSLYQSAILQLLQQSAKSMKIKCSNKTHKKEISTFWNSSNVCTRWSASLHIYTSLYNYTSHHHTMLAAFTNVMSGGWTRSMFSPPHDLLAAKQA